MKIKSGFTLKNIDGQQVIVASGEAVTGYTSSIVLQETATYLWNCLKEREMTKEQMVNALLENFDISTVLALSDVDSFFKTLKENGILE
ncbi:MAG: PqqD family protein [Clostridia bacterium]|nr:PqqD family protein [Clostridia bacterium]